MKSFFHIAIDGPVAAGKGTASKLVAQKLGFLYIDTGAMYRMAAMLAAQHGVDFNDEAKIVSLVKQAKMAMHSPRQDEQDGRLITVLLNGEDVSWKIRSKEISEGASKVSILLEVRKILVEKQKEIAQGKNVVMEGRDITYRVLPDADLKIFLDAALSARAERRVKQIQATNPQITLEKILKEIAERDERDMGRSADPLQIVPDAWVLDTTDLTPAQVADTIVHRVHEIRQLTHEKD